MMPHHWQDDTASGYTISTRVPCEDSATIFKQDCTRKETDATLSFFGLHQDNSEQSIGEPGTDLGFPSLWYSALFDVPEPRTSSLQFSKLPLSPSLQNTDASESALHFRQVSCTSPKPTARDTTDFSKRDVITRGKSDIISADEPLPSPLPVNTPHTSLSSTIDPRVPELVLVDADLWSKFHEQNNEMIITKSGRCLFPCLRFKAVHLDPTALYTIYLDFELTDSRRFKFEDGGWRASSTNTRTDGNSGGMAAALAKESYTHPDKYQTGDHWMKGTIFFDKAKLSNSRESAARSARRASSIKSAVGNSHHIFHMSSFHKYRPRVHLVQRAARPNAVASSTTYTFHQTTFIAVTHYQNSKVNDLKKGFNPHARGFRGPAEMSRSLSVTAEQTPSRSVTRSERTRALKRRYCERDTSESDAADADETESDQSRDDVDDDDLDSGISTLPEMTRTSSSETSEKSLKSFCRLNKDNCALVSISISKGKIEAKQTVGGSIPTQESKRLQRKDTIAHYNSRSSRSRASRAQLHLHSIHTASADSSSTAKNAGRKQRIYKSRRLESSSSRTQSSASTSTKSSSKCSITSNRGRRLDCEPHTTEPACNIQEKFAQLSASHAVSSDQQNDPHHGPKASPLNHSPPTAPPLSWYQQFVYWDQPSQALTRQAIQRPVLPTAAQSSSESNSCLMLPFSMDKSLDYVMLHGPPPSTPSEALSGTFADTTGSVAQETLALDAPDASALLGPHTHMVNPGTRHTRSQVHIRAEEGSASSQIQSNPTTTFTTILESRTLMSTTSERAILPSSYSSTSAHLEHALRENLRLKAFIRARYGSEAEAEANAVMAMERRQ